MQFNTRTLIGLTVVVAAASAAVRFFELQSFWGVIVVLAFTFAPLLLALLSSFFARTNATLRRRVGYLMLVIIAMLPLRYLWIFSRGLTVVVEIVMLALWVPQLEIFNDVHQTEA